MAALETPPLVSRELRLQRLVTAYILAGLLFMLLPGTFLGVWNLISISSRRALDSLSPAWIQAHGHAQFFGWIGTFILAIGFYSLSKMGNMEAFAIWRGWACFGLWITGVSLRWFTNITAWQWRIVGPLSGALEIAAFALFFTSVWRHRPAQPHAGPRRTEAWIRMVVCSTLGFLVTLGVNLAVEIFWRSERPALPCRTRSTSG